MCQAKPPGEHLARYLDAYIAASCPAAQMAAVLGDLVVIARQQIILDGARCARAARTRRCGDRYAADADRPADEPWARTSDRSVRPACKRGLVLTVTRLVAGGWQAVVEGPRVTELLHRVIQALGQLRTWLLDELVIPSEVTRRSRSRSQDPYTTSADANAGGMLTYGPRS